MLYWVYILMAAYISILILIEMFAEKAWKKQMALAMVLLIFVLRVLQIK